MDPLASVSLSQSEFVSVSYLFTEMHMNCKAKTCLPEVQFDSALPPILNALEVGC